MGRPINPEDEEGAAPSEFAPQAPGLGEQEDGDDDDDDDDFEEDDEYPVDGDDEPEWEDPSEGGVLTLVMEAAESGDADELGELLGRLSVSVDTPGEDGDSALHLACLFGQAACARKLLDAGASPTAKDEDGSTPLHDASAGGYIEIVQMLLGAGGSSCVNQLDADGETPLHLGARGDHKALVELLLAEGADPLITNGLGRTAEQEARGCPEVQEVLRAAMGR